MTWIVAAQPVLLAAILLWSGPVKLAAGAGEVAGTALHRLLGGRLAAPAYRTVGVVETIVAFALLVVPGWPAPVGAAVLAVGFLGYLGYGTVAAPQASCGCLGGKAKARVSWRAYARAGLMLVAAVATALAGGGSAWWHTPRVAGTAVLVVVEAAAVVALSAELDRYWLLPLRRARVRLTHPLAGAPADVPLHATVTQLQRSDAYRRVAALLHSDVTDHWDVDEWRILCYAIRHRDRSATAVFAVPRLREDPAAVRLSIVEDDLPVPA